MHKSISRKIYDAVHGFIRFNELERELIDSEPFQRLHDIRQLGVSYLVYPGATHSRFEHSLGVMELATRMYDRIVEKWQKAEDVAYWRQIVRLAALCHDLGHLPFSHVAERLVLGKGGHERWTLDVICSPFTRPIWHRLQKDHSHRDVVSDVVKISLGEEKLTELAMEHPFSAWERVMSQIITGDFFGADRMDYLLRDAQSTGVAYGLFDYHQLIEMLCILPGEGGGLELGVEEDGVESCEALLLARHFMYKRVYQYSSVKACSFHLSQFIKKFYDKEKKLKTLRDYLSVTDSEILSSLKQAKGDPTHYAHVDALRLLDRTLRYRAIQIPESWSQESMEALKLPTEALFYSPSGKVGDKKGLDFPVLKKNGVVISASQVSEIAIPSGSGSWAYVAPAHEAAVRKSLQEPLPSQPLAVR